MAGSSFYWEAEYGIGSLDEFVSETEAFMPSMRLWGFGWDRDQIARLAYYGPHTEFGKIVDGALFIKRRLLGEPAAAGEFFLTKTIRALEDGALKMPQLIIPNVYRVGIYGEAGGQPVVNVVGVRGSASGQHVGAAQAVLTAWKLTEGPLRYLPTAYALQAVSAMDLSSADGGIHEETATGAGGQTGGVANNGGCALVKWNGGTRSGSNRGRMYFGPLTDVAVNTDGRTFNSAWVTPLTAAFENFRNSLSGAGFPLVVISRVKSSAALVTSHSVENIIATQRRRVRG
jgi:hypothetical protein